MDEPSSKRRRFHLGTYTEFNTRYKSSYPHDSLVTAIAKGGPLNELIILGLESGCIEFWEVSEQAASDKKISTSDEDSRQLLRKKRFMAHPTKPILQFAVNHKGSRLASLAKGDDCVKVYDLDTLDMISLIPLHFNPSFKSILTCAWFEDGIDDNLAICDDDSSNIYIVDIENSRSAKCEMTPHRTPVIALASVPQLRCIVSTDAKGLIEIWNPTGEKADVEFKLKSDTMLYDLPKNRVQPQSLAVSSNGQYFAISLLPDAKIRVFWTRSGKIVLTIPTSAESKAVSMSFDNDAKTLLHSTSLGIQCTDLLTGASLAVLGSDDVEHFSEFVLLENASVMTLDTEHAAASNSIIRARTSRPPLVVGLANTTSMYLFAHHQTVASERAVHDGTLTHRSGASITIEVFKKVTIHTTLGDITIELYPQLVPRTVENFTTLCQRHYYNNVIFHRVIPGFMIQTGDPQGTGQGGDSAWGGSFADEFHRLLNHERPFTVSMANAGPHTNRSQFFITTEPASFLDQKHSVFGNVVDGFDVVRSIEKAETDAEDRPIEQVIILSTTLM